MNLNLLCIINAFSINYRHPLLGFYLTLTDGWAIARRIHIDRVESEHVYMLHSQL